MISKLKDFRIGFDPATRYFVIELRFAKNFRIIFQAEMHVLIQMRTTLDETIKNVPAIEEENE